MTQQGYLFKGKKKQKTIPPNRHGKLPHIRRGKRVVKPYKMTKEMDADRELFVNHWNEIKAAMIVNKDGGQLSTVKLPPESSGDLKEH